MSRKYDGSKQRELDQRLSGLSPETRGRRRLADTFQVLHFDWL
jgi:hypothetical protein